MNNNQYLTVEQVAAYLQVHWQTILNFIKRGELEAVKIGRGYRISHKALDEFTESKSTKRDNK